MTPAADLVTFAPWIELPWLRHGTTTRTFAHDARDKHETAERLAGRLVASSSAYVWGSQCHGTRVEWVDQRHEPPASFEETDSLATARRGIMLACFTADCVPVVAVDVEQRVVGTAHAGWRGSFAGVTIALLRSMIERGSSPDALHVWIGPAIGGDVYEVGEELAASFAQRFTDWSSMILRGRMLNLPLLNALQAEAVGVDGGHIAIAPLCTYRNRERFFSFRRDGSSGTSLVTGVAIVDG